jgi:hypothetical protein
MLFAVTSATFQSVFAKMLILRNPDINIVEILLCKYTILSVLLLLLINVKVKAYLYNNLTA